MPTWTYTPPDPDDPRPLPPPYTFGHTDDDADPTAEKRVAFTIFSEPMFEDLELMQMHFEELLHGPPLLGRGLEYWESALRYLVAERALRVRLARAWRRSRWDLSPLHIRIVARDLPRRLGNARAALAGDWGPREIDE